MIFSYFLVWAVFALHPHRSMAKPPAQPDTLEEGSGYGVVNPFYDEDDNDVTPYDENDSYDGGGNYLDYDDNIYGIKPTLEPEEQKIMTCFHCLGDGNTGCDSVAMISNPDKYSINCIGRCLNISSGPTAVYDCARDLTVDQDACFINGDTRLCFCSGDLCNRPNSAISLLAVFKPLFTTNTPPPKIPTDLRNFSPSLDLINSSLASLSNASDDTNSSGIPFFGSVSYPSQTVDLPADMEGKNQVRLPKYLGGEIDIVIPEDSATIATEGNASSLTSRDDFDSQPGEVIQSPAVGSSRERSSSPSLWSHSFSYYFLLLSVFTKLFLIGVCL